MSKQEPTLQDLVNEYQKTTNQINTLSQTINDLTMKNNNIFIMIANKLAEEHKSKTEKIKK